MAVATEHTLDFVGFYLPPAGQVLVVSAERSLADALARLGHRVRVVNAIAEVDEAPAFDAVVFDRTLHRTTQLAAVFERVDRVLGPRGVVLVEDLAWERADAATAASDREWRGEPLAPEAALGAWRAEHAAVATGEAMRLAAAERFAHVESGECPYLYRRAGGDRETIFREEARRISTGAIRPLGWRLVIH